MKNTSTYASSIAALASISGILSPALANQKIDTVTLYPNTAVIQTSQQIKAGSQHAEFFCLPANIDPQSLAVNIEADPKARVNIGEITMRYQSRKSLQDKCGGNFYPQIQNIKKEIAKLGAKEAGLTTSTDFLKNLGAGYSGANIQNTASEIQARVQKNLLEKIQIAEEKQELENQLANLKEQAGDEHDPNQIIGIAKINLSTNSPAKISLSYQVKNVTWQPNYKAELDTKTGKLKITSQALISQRTGQDWQNIALTLSTGTPNNSPQGSIPQPWRVNLYTAPPPRAAAAIAPMVAMARMSKNAESQEDAIVLEENLEENFGKNFQIESQTNGYETSFTLPQKISLPSGKRKISLALETAEFNAELITRANPAQEPKAWLVAQIGKLPDIWAAGEILLYRDGTYIGRGFFDSKDIEQLGLAFGTDERISIKNIAPKLNETKTGYITNQTEKQISKNYIIENRYKENIKIQILESAPVSENSQIIIKNTYNPEPETKSFNQTEGLIMWSTNLAPQQTKEFKAEYQINWPTNRHLMENK